MKRSRYTEAQILAILRQGAGGVPMAEPSGSARFVIATAPLLSDENEQIADLLVGLTEARKAWGFGLCFLHLRNVKGHP